jgi:hypothetical protein
MYIQYNFVLAIPPPFSAFLAAGKFKACMTAEVAVLGGIQ